MKDDVEETKLKNIVNMAVSFAGMSRVFKAGSTEKIRNKLYSTINGFLSSHPEKEYQTKHEKFCEWFTKNIKTAQRKKEGRIIKKSEDASWGQAAKIIDIVLKVFIYYCKLPSPEVSAKIIPLLNAPIDEARLKSFKNYTNHKTLQDLDDYNEYKALQRHMLKICSKNKISRVEYDDLQWRKEHNKK